MEVLFPFKCEYCDRLFCSYHKLPENHQCPNLPKKPISFIEARISRSKPKPDRTTVGPASREATVEPMSEGSTESAEPSRERENTERSRSKHSGMPKKLKVTIVMLCAMLVVVPFVAAFGSYTFGFSNGSDSGYDQGHEVGYQSGNSSGYQLGYSGGYTQGNDTGYGNGYMIGYENGNSSGFSEGYSDGNASGYSRGYQTGYAIGNSSGYSQGYSNGNAAGYQSGYLQGVKDGAGSGYNIRNPTYQEMLNFIAADQTDKNPYIHGSYVCWNFAADVTNNAFKAGYRCGWVYVEFAYTAHATVCFNTTDHGLIFVEPQDDMIMNLAVGQPYWGDTVLRYGIIW